ncbi:MAG TPA: phosphoesterase [Verrucomicrobiales bacterium]|nr:phosphoesterase [Verrucomicrobiales bacterium]
MQPLPQPEVILTHESDLDGLFSGLLLRRLAEKLFSVTPRLEAWNYNGWRNRDLTEASAWVCDLTFEPRLDRSNWLIIDHHATDALPQKARLIHDLEKSAGTLCHELCREHGLGSPELERLAHLNNVADLFLVGDSEFDLAGDYANLVKTYGFWNLFELIGGRLENLLDHPLLEVMTVKRRVEDPLGYEWSRANVVEITPEIGHVPTIIGNNNLIVHRLLDEKATPYPVLMTLFRKATGAVLVSLRSKDGRALKVAEKLQGGGHANAAGATLPRSIKQIPEAIDYLRQTLSPKPRAATSLNNLGDLLSAIER